MASFETVEKLRGKAHVSFEDAREALEQSNDDLLDAIIFLEKSGKLPPPAGGYYRSGTKGSSSSEGRSSSIGYESASNYSNEYGHAYYHDSKSSEGNASSPSARAHKSRRAKAKHAYYYDERDKRADAPPLFASFKRFLVKAFTIGNNTQFEVSRKGAEVIKLPLTIAVVALIFLFKLIVILLIVGLFFGFRYRISSRQFDDGPVNSAMDSVSNAADTIKDAFSKNFRR